MTAPATPANPSSPAARVYDGLRLSVLGYAAGVSLATNGSGTAFTVPRAQRALLVMVIIDGFSATKLDSGITLSYGFTATAYGELFSAALGSIVGKGVTGFTISDGGTGYVTAPTVALTALDLGRGATAVAALTADVVTSILVTNPGQGYVVAPTVDFTGANTTPAAATATIGTATLAPSNPITIAQQPTLALIAGGFTVSWAITNAVTGSGTCNITWLGGLI